MGRHHPEVPDDETPQAPVPAPNITAADRGRLIEMIDGTEKLCAATQAAVPSDVPVPPELLDMLVRMSDTVEGGPTLQGVASMPSHPGRTRGIRSG